MASRGINKVILVGNLGQDPDTKYTAGGDAVTNISIATSEAWKGRDGEKQESTEWHKVVFFGKLADIAAQYLVKGAKVFVEGKLKTESWEDKDGNKRSTVKIHAHEMQMLDGKKDSEQSERRTTQKYDKHSYTPSQPTDDNFDDDIPF